MTDAPKIDTQAPVWPQGGYAPGSYWCKCVSCDQQFTGDKRAYQCPDCIIQALASLSAAREAAVALEMRNACLDALPDMGDDPVYPGWVLKTFLTKVTAIPAPDGAAALDRLIAERVREAVEAEREACALRAEVQFDERGRSRSGHHSEMDWTDGYRDATRGAAAAIRARSESNSHINSKVIE